MALARSPLATFAGPCVLAWRHPRPRRQPRRRVKTCPVEAALGSEVTRGDRTAARHTPQLRTLRGHWRAQCLEGLLHVATLATQDSDQRQRSGNARGVVRGQLPVKGHCALGDLPTHAPQRQG